MDVSMCLTVHRMYSTSISHFFCISSTRWAHQIKTCEQPGAEKVEGNWGTANLSQHTVLKVEGRIVSGMLHKVNLDEYLISLIMFDLCMSFQGITYQ